MKTAVLLSVRNKSTRFPGKVLREIGGQTLTEILVQRLQLVRNVDKVIIATSDDPRDQVFKDIAAKNKVDIFYGSKEDKLLRYRDVALEYDLDSVAIVDGDDILVFPEFIEKSIELIEISDADAVFTKGLPLGAASSVLSRSALEKVLELKDESDTEVWGGYFINSGYFDVNFIYVRSPSIFNYPEIRLTLDYEEDFEFLEQVLKHFNHQVKIFTSYDLMKLLTVTDPKLTTLNLEAQKRYEKHISGAAPVKFKELK